jgi:DNA-binding transcriptional ArsR family regulator
MIPLNKADLIIHPTRLRILRELDSAELTTQELSGRLADVPTSSIYRHLKLLLDGELVEVSDTRLVKGIQEKIYRLARSPIVGPSEVADWTAEDHVRYFNMYALTLIHDFNAYVSGAEQVQGTVDMMADRVGYREVYLNATTEELDEAVGAMNKALLPLLNNELGNGRRQYKLATIMHPLNEERDNG